MDGNPPSDSQGVTRVPIGSFGMYLCLVRFFILFALFYFTLLSCDVMYHNIFYIILTYGLFYSVVSCCAVLCCVVLCCVVLSCVVLC